MRTFLYSRSDAISHDDVSRGECAMLRATRCGEILVTNVKQESRYADGKFSRAQLEVFNSVCSLVEGDKMEYESMLSRG